MPRTKNDVAVRNCSIVVLHLFADTASGVTTRSAIFDQLESKYPKYTERTRNFTWRKLRQAGLIEAFRLDVAPDRSFLRWRLSGAGELKLEDEAIAFATREARRRELAEAKP